MKEQLYKFECANNKEYAVEIESNKKYDLVRYSSIGDSIVLYAFELYLCKRIWQTIIVKKLDSGEYKVVTPFKCHENLKISICSCINRDYILVTDGLKYGVIDYDYNFIVNLEYDSIKQWFVSGYRSDDYHKDILIAKKGNYEYLINLKHKKVFGPYENTFNLYSGARGSWVVHFAKGVKKTKTKSKYEFILLSSWKKLHKGYINDHIIFENYNLILLKKDNIWTGWFLEEETDRWEFKGLSKKLIYQYQEAFKETDGLFITKRDGKYGVINIEEQTIIPFIYDKIYDKSEMENDNQYLRSDGCLISIYDEKKHSSRRKFTDDIFSSIRIVEKNDFNVKSQEVIDRWLCVIKE